MSMGIRLAAAMNALLLGKEPTGAALHNRYLDMISISLSLQEIESDHLVSYVDSTDCIRILVVGIPFELCEIDLL